MYIQTPMSADQYSMSGLGILGQNVSLNFLRQNTMFSTSKTVSVWALVTDQDNNHIPHVREFRRELDSPNSFDTAVGLPLRYREYKPELGRMLGYERDLPPNSGKVMCGVTFKNHHEFARHEDGEINHQFVRSSFKRLNKKE